MNEESIEHIFIQCLVVDQLWLALWLINLQRMLPVNVNGTLFLYTEPVFSIGIRKGTG